MRGTIVAAAAGLLLGLGRMCTAGVTAGGELGAENWEQASGLLPEEFLAAYRRGDFRHPIGQWSIERIGDDPVFREALDANRDRYDLTAEGSIVDKHTGDPPEYVHAWPFPSIDPQDPKAAMKIVWNYFYTLYYGGNGHYRADLQWLSRSGLERSVAVDAYFKHYDGQHPRFREPDADRELLSQMLANVRTPADVAGLVSLTWRYRPAQRRDSIWVFVPALRRVRQVSPANRSDGFLGSDMTQDDGAYFDGKVEDFTWKLVGEQDLLVLFDRASFEEPAQLERLPGGGWRMIVPDRPRLGFQLPEWKGAPWCPTGEILVRRPHWVVEAVPKDPYYLYGKLVLRFDKDIFLGSYSSKYDWSGNLLASYAAVRTNVVKVAPGEFWGWAGSAVAVALNWKQDRATTAGIAVGAATPADSRVPLDPSLFSLQRLTALGR
jgi:hypothetical protein